MEEELRENTMTVTIEDHWTGVKVSHKFIADRAKLDNNKVEILKTADVFVENVDNFEKNYISDK